MPTQAPNPAQPIVLLTDGRTLQSFLNRNIPPQVAPPLVVDGDFGPRSIAHARMFIRNRFARTPLSAAHEVWPNQRIVTSLEQHLLSNFHPLGDPDGIAGPRTRYALEVYQNKIRDLPTPDRLSPNPATATIPPGRTPTKLYRSDYIPPDFGRQKDMTRIYGPPATESNLVTIATPYPLYLDWDLKVSTRKLRLHKLVAESAEVALQRIHDHYGVPLLHKLGLDQLGGSYNPRRMRGGSSWSMHAWGTAIDWDADRNSLRMGPTQARFATVRETHAFLDIWESVGWTSLGRARGYDFMHVQAPRL